MDKIHSLIVETIREGLVEESLRELNEENNKKFMSMLKLLYDTKKPTKKLVEVNLYNINEALESLTTLLGHKYKPSEALLQRLYEMRESIEKVLDSYGMESEIGKRLRKLYLSVQAYLKYIESKYPYQQYYPKQHAKYPKYYYKGKYPERKETELSEEFFNPDEYYKECLERDRQELFRRLKTGESPLLDRILKPKNDKEIVESLARDNIIYWSMHGVLPERDDLAFTLGYKTLGQKSDELMLEGIKKIEERERKHRLDEAKHLEGIETEEMSNVPEWLSSRITKRLEKNRH